VNDKIVKINIYFISIPTYINFQHTIENISHSIILFYKLSISFHSIILKTLRHSVGKLIFRWNTQHKRSNEN
jgi:hypothetical protein